MKSSLFFCNREEFVEVADLVLSNTPESDLKAISRLAHWKCCLANLPAQVLCTHSLLVIKSFRALEAEPPNNAEFNASPTSYIAEEFRNLAYASGVSRSISLLLEDNENLHGFSMKATANALGLPDWLTDVRNEIAHGRRMLSLDFLSSVVDRILTWLRESFWGDLLAKYSNFVKTGANGSPFWLQLENLLVMYEQQTYRAVTISETAMRVVATRRRIVVVRQLGSIAKQNLPEFCQCFVRAGYMFPTIEQLRFLGVDEHVLSLWSDNKQSALSSSHNSLNKRINLAFLKTRKFWKMLIFHLFTAVDDAIPALIESVVKSCPPNPGLFDRQIRQNCWIHYLIDKYVSKTPRIGTEVMQRCAKEATPISLAALRRLSFIDWPRRSDSVKCGNLIDLMSAFIGPQEVMEIDPTTVTDENGETQKKIFTAEDAEVMMMSQSNSA